jgi:hypothetical protein
MVCSIARGKSGTFTTLEMCEKSCARPEKSLTLAPVAAPKGSKLEHDLMAVEEDVEKPIDENTLEAAEAQADAMAKEKAETEATSEEMTLEKKKHEDTEELQEEEEQADAAAKEKVVEEDAAELKEEKKEASAKLNPPSSTPTLNTKINSFLDGLSIAPTATPTTVRIGGSVSSFLDALSTAPTATPTATKIGGSVTSFLDGLSTAPTVSPTAKLGKDDDKQLTDEITGVEISTSDSPQERPLPRVNPPSTADKKDDDDKQLTNELVSEEGGVASETVSSFLDALSTVPTTAPTAEPTYMSAYICKKASCNICEAARDECCNDFMHTSGQCEGCVKSKGCTVAKATPAPTHVPTAEVVEMPPVTETPTAIITTAPTSIPTVAITATPSALPTITSSPSPAPTVSTASPTPMASPVVFTYMCAFPQMKCEPEAEGVDGAFKTLASCEEVCHMPTEAPSTLPTASPSLPPSASPSLPPSPLPTPIPTAKVNNVKINVISHTNASESTKHPCVRDMSYFNPGPPAQCIPCNDLIDCAVGKYRLGCGGGASQADIGECVPCQTPKKHAHHTSFGRDHGDESSCDEDCDAGFHEHSFRCVAVTAAPTLAPTAAPTAKPTKLPRTDMINATTVMPTDQFIVRSCIQMTGFTIKDFNEIAKHSFRVALASACKVGGLFCRCSS